MFLGTEADFRADLVLERVHEFEAFLLIPFKEWDSDRVGDLAGDALFDFDFRWVEDVNKFLISWFSVRNC